MELFIQFILAFVGLLAVIIYGCQLKEMRDGGTDTHNLSIAAKEQASRMQDFANQMKDQSAKTKDLADQMKIQANRTTTIAEQAVVQARAAQITAESSVSANRAWMIPEGYAQPNPVTILFKWKNAGLSPAAQVSASAEYQEDDLASRFIPGCDHLKHSHSWIVAAPMVIQNAPFEITLQGMPESWYGLPEKPSELKVMQIHGCVWYKDVLTNLTRTTEFCYEAATRKPKNPESPRTTVFPGSCLTNSETLIFH